MNLYQVTSTKQYQGFILRPFAGKSTAYPALAPSYEDRQTEGEL